MPRPLAISVPPKELPRSEADWRPVYELLRGLANASRASQTGLAAITRGENPDGTGTTLFPSLDDYLYLPGRTGGQTVQQKDASPAVTIQGLADSLTTIGTFGDPIFRIKDGDTVLADFRPYLFATSTVELAVTDDAGDGIPVNFPSDDGTSAFRIASTTNRTYLQCGLKNSGNGVDNANMTIGGAGATLATSLAYEFSRIKMSNSAGTARTTRVGINVNIDDYASSSVSNKAGSLHIWGNNDGSDSSPAPLILERGSVTGTTSARNLFEVRDDSTGTTPNMVLGAIRLAFDGAGRIKLYNSGTYHSQITAGSNNTGTVTFLDSSGNQVFEFQPLARWADSAASSNLKIGAGASNAMISGGGYNILARLGISATSIVLGPANSITLPAPLSSRILTIVNSAGTVLSGFDSVGAHFHVSGAGAGKVWTDSAGTGVGSWQTPSGGLSAAADESITGAWDFDGITDFDKQLRVNPARGSTTVPYLEFRTKASLTHTTKVAEFYDSLDALTAYIDGYGTWHFQASTNLACMRLGDGDTTFPVFMAGTSLMFGIIEDYATWNSSGFGSSGLYLTLDSAPTGFNTLVFPSSGGTMLTTTNTVTLQNKTLGNLTTIKTGNTFSGAMFSSTTTASKKFYFECETNLLSGTTVKLLVPQRNNHTLVTKGGEVISSGRTAASDAAAATIVTSDAGYPTQWRITAAVSVTTAGTGGNTLDVYVKWTNGTGTYTHKIINGVSLDTVDGLDGTTGYFTGRINGYVSTSQNIQYYTVLTPASGSPVYDLFISVESI